MEKDGLTVGELAKHRHPMNPDAAGIFAGWGSQNAEGWVTASAQGNGGLYGTDDTGNNECHNNISPCLPINMWKRLS